MIHPITILFRDDDLLVVSKPPGLLSVPTPGASGPSVPELLLQRDIRALPVHRLDREVSGAMLLALNERTRAALESQFRARELKKTYWALAQGQLRPASGAFHFPILAEGAWARVSARGKPAVTRYRALEILRNSTVLEIDLITGRYNQIRLHFAHAGFPLVGERKYARGKDSSLRMRSRRVALHAWRLSLFHPVTRTSLDLEAPLPSDLVELLESATRA